MILRQKIEQIVRGQYPWIGFNRTYFERDGLLTHYRSVRRFIPALQYNLNLDSPFPSFMIRTDSTASSCYHFDFEVEILIRGEAEVASLSVRKIDDETVAHLRVRAAKHGVSMEEEVRRILQRVVATPERLGDLAVRLFSPAYGGSELELPPRETHEPPEFH